MGSVAHHHTEGNVFEKMGFGTGGVSGPAQDTARNTSKTVDLLTQLRDSIIMNQRAHDGQELDYNINAPI